MATIGDLVLRVIGDYAEFQKKSEAEAKKAGDTAAKGWGDSFKKAGMLALQGGLAASFAVMAKGAAEMERAQGNFVAATGRSREEAVAFADDMNSLVGRASTVGRSFEEISAAGIQVAQQFDLTGEAGTALTEDFLAFSKVTGQDAAGAVDSFDAALDAFGEPAERAAGLMDQLVASNQEYGTNAGPEALSALANMAPALQAMNMGLDEGVGLLNLFEDAGIDAGSTTAALNKAILSLEPGENLDDLIAEIGAIEDPTLRAEAAMRIFGQRAGAKMANAIQPGMTSISEFGISVEEAGDRTTEAAEAMMTTSDRIKGFFEQLRGGLRDVGSEFGPLVTGFSSLATLIGPALMKSTAAITISGQTLGTIFGSAFGTTAGAAAALAVVALPAIVFLAVLKWGTPAVEDFSVYLSNTLTGAKVTPEAQRTFDQTVQAAIQSNADENGGLLAGTIFDSFGDGWNGLWAMGGQGRGALAPMTPAVEEAGTEAGAAMGLTTVGSFFDTFGLGFAPALEESVAEGVAQARDGLGGTFQDAASIHARQLGQAAVWREAGSSALIAFGESAQSEAEAQMGLITSIRDMLEHGLTPRDLAMQAIGKKYIRDVGKGIDSEVIGLTERAQGAALQAIGAIEDAGLEGGRGQRGLRAIGSYFDQLLGSGMTAPQILARLEENGETVTDTVKDILFDKTGYREGGANIANAWGGGITGAMTAWRDELITKMNGIRTIMHGTSPPKEGPLKDIDKGGANIGDAWGESFVGRVAHWSEQAQQAMGLTSGLAFATPSVAGFGDIGVNANSTLRVEHVLSREGAAALREEGFDEEGVAGFLRNLGREYGLPHQVTR